VTLGESPRRARLRRLARAEDEALAAFGELVV
jgi:hypothetical protein